MPVRCLSIHARYRCGHSGACCSGVFAIPVEPHVVRAVAVLGLQAPLAASPVFVRRPSAAGAEYVAAQRDGTCVFLEAASSGRSCVLHRRGGVDALPAACRHFPRIFLHDARGLFLSLSHFCPTAASMLLDDGPLTIVEAHAPLALDHPVDAFEAVDALPPLLRPGLLMDLAAYDAWERAAVDTFARDDLTHEQALAVIDAVTESVRLWKAGERSLASHVESAFASIQVPSLLLDERRGDGDRLRLIDGDHSPGRTTPVVWATFDRPIKRFLAAKLFGNRIAYESRGLRSIVEWLHVALAALRREAAQLAADAGTALDRDLFVEAVRATDLALVHRLDSLALARRLEPIETYN